MTTAKRSGAGAFVVIVGPDGTGKTTLARGLTSAHPGPTWYFHFRPRLRGGRAPTPPRESSPPAVKVPHRRAGDLAMGWLRILRSAIGCSAAYWLRIRPAVRRGELVVGDRWIYGYVTQPEPLRFYGPDWLGRLAIRLTPKPTLTIVLYAPIPVLLARKQELSADQLARELATTRNLRVGQRLMLSSEKPPSSLVATAYAHLYEGGSDPLPSASVPRNGDNDRHN